MTVGVVNPTEQKSEIAMDVKGVNLTGTGKLWVITHNDPMAYNEPGKAPNVIIEEKQVTDISNKLIVPPYSVCIYELAVR